MEIGGGSVRIHDAALQDFIFTNILQVSCGFINYITKTHHAQLDEREKAPFQQLIRALQSGAPPHGGIALGIYQPFRCFLLETHRFVLLTGFDRIMAMLCGAQSIRDVIAFPKTSSGADPLFKSPATISNKTLSQYGIRSAGPSPGN